MSLLTRPGQPMLPLRDWSLQGRDVLSLVGEDKPDRKLLLAVQEVRLIVEPAAAQLAPALASGKNRPRVHVTMAAIKAPRNQAAQTAAGRAFYRAILDVTRNLGAAVLARRDPHDHERCIRVAVNGVDGWFEGNLAHHVTTQPRHRRSRRRQSRLAMEQILGFSRSKPARSKAGDGCRNCRPGGSRSLRNK